MTVPSDIIWSFATGCIFAASAADGLKQAGGAFVNKYFVYLTCYVCFLLAPSRLYLLWEHTGWATAFYYDATISGVWPCLYLLVLAALCSAGYLAGRRLVLTDRGLAAYGLAAASYSCTVGVFSFWYDRILYAGDIGDWYSDVKYSKVQFLSSQVFVVLLALGVLTVPPVLYAALAWPNDENLMLKARKQVLTRHSMSYYCLATVIKALAILVLVATTSSPWGYERLLVFAAGQAVGGALLYAALSCIRTRHRSKKAP